MNWQWDPSLFRGTAAHYVPGRVPHAADLVETLSRILSLDGSGRVLDVGCGPGTVALALAHLFSEAHPGTEVLVWEPDHTGAEPWPVLSPCESHVGCL